MLVLNWHRTTYVDICAEFVGCPWMQVLPSFPVLSVCKYGAGKGTGCRGV